MVSEEMKWSGTCNYHLSRLTMQCKPRWGVMRTSEHPCHFLRRAHIGLVRRCSHLVRWTSDKQRHLMPRRYSDFWNVSPKIQFLCCLYISVIVCFVMMSGFGAKFVLLLSLHNNSEAARCPDYWSISLRRRWRDSPGLPAQTGDEGYHP